VLSWLDACKDLLFPPCCLSCERRLDSSLPPLFCPECAGRLPFIVSPHCRTCGEPFPTGSDHLCGKCLSRTLPFDYARSLFFYEPPISTLLLALKFHGELTALSSLGQLMGHPSSVADFADPDLLLPVPLHLGRLRQRGFNQALLLARACFPLWTDRLTPDLLVRNRATPPQTGLSGKERRRNLNNAFQLRRPEQVRGKRILLVDDVLTTGSTVDECSRVLRAAGALRVEVFTVARSLTG
jgi:ComF family protein